LRPVSSMSEAANAKDSATASIANESTRASPMPHGDRSAGVGAHVIHRGDERRRASPRTPPRRQRPPPRTPSSMEGRSTPGGALTAGHGAIWRARWPASRPARTRAKSEVAIGHRRGLPAVPDQQPVVSMTCSDESWASRLSSVSPARSTAIVG
jgi:hypothetical protein